MTSIQVKQKELTWSFFTTSKWKNLLFSMAYEYKNMSAL